MLFTTEICNPPSSSFPNISKTNIIPVMVEDRLLKRLLNAFIYEKCLPYQFIDNLLIIPLKKNKVLIAQMAKRVMAGRFVINGEISLINGNNLYALKKVNDLLSILKQEICDLAEVKQWSVFNNEITNCLENDILVTQHMELINDKFRIDIKNSKYTSFIEYIYNSFTTQEQLTFFESWSTRGHPYHPCHKTKLGFSREEYIKYSPEFQQNVELILAAVDKLQIHLVTEETELDYQQWFASQFPEYWDTFCIRLKTENLSESTYFPIFIHPWQYQYKIENLFLSYLEKKQLIIFKDITIASKASLSFRTMIVNDELKKPHIKVPIAVHSTSALRTNSPASIENSPKISNVLRQILIKENYFSQKIKIAYESYCLRIKHDDADLVKHLAIIYRDNPINFITTNQLPIVVAALFEESPLNKTPLFIEIMQTAVGDTLNEAIKYFNQYCLIILSSYLDLLLLYGIALEGHQQNTIAVFEKYHPIFMIARDLNGLRIHEPTLKSQGFSFKHYPNSDTVTEVSQEVTNKFLHTVIQSHLGEIILLISQYYKISEDIFWNIVKNNIELRFNVLKNKIEPTRWHQVYKAILVDDWQTKALLRMRLNSISKKYIYINNHNPLKNES